MARKKAVPKPAPKVRRESWRLENLRARLKRNDTSADIELYAVAREAVDAIEDLEREVFEMQKRLDDASKTIDDKDSKISDLEEKIEEFDSEVADAARRVIELVPVVLGREDVVSESVEAFDLRRAVEDLKTVC